MFVKSALLLCILYGYQVHQQQQEVFRIYNISVKFALLLCILSGYQIQQQQLGVRGITIFL
jgi:hypothetical protein